MHILAFILMFVVGSIGAALDGDFSGIDAIGKFVFGAEFFIGVMWMMATCPGLLILICVVLFLVVYGLSSESKENAD